MDLNDITSLVVGTDASPASDRAIEWACRFASRHGLRVRVVMAVHLPMELPIDGEPIFASASGYTPEVVANYLAAMRADVSEQVARIGARHPGVELSGEVVQGSPAPTLLELVGEHDMVVVGRQGGSGVLDHLLGSITDAMLSHCRQPVVVVGKQDDTTAQGPVVVGLDETGSAQALALAGAVAAAEGIPLELVSAVGAPQMWNEPFGLGVPDTVMAAASRRLDGVVERLRERYPGLPIEGHVETGRPADALERHSKGAGLLVVGSRGRGGFTGLLLGSTSRRLASRSRCPVVVVRSKLDAN